MIAGPKAFICDDCVMLCTDVLAEPPLGSDSPGLGNERLLVRLPDGSVHLCERVSEWKSLLHHGDSLEWCLTESKVRSTTKLVVVAVRREPALRTILGAAFSPEFEPTSAHLESIASRFADTEEALEQRARSAERSPWIGEELVTFLHPNGRKADGRIAVGTPFEVDEAGARCRVALDGLETLSPVGGPSTLHALTLAVRLLGNKLHAFRARGGRILERGTDNDVAIEAIFGSMLVD